MMENPLSRGITRVVSQIGQLNCAGWNFIPSLVPLMTLGLVLMIFLLLWPYGFIPVIADSLWRLLKDARDQTRREPGLIERMPGAVAMGVYFLVWLPFAVLSLPFVIIGLVGWFFSSD